MYQLKTSTAQEISFFAHDGNGDAVTGKVDGDWTKRIKKNAGAWGDMTVTITEEENGWYKLTLSTSHTDTPGVLTLTFTAAGVKQVNLQYRVYALIVSDNVVVGTINANAITSGSFAAGAIAAAAIATDAIDSAKISAAAANKLADHVVRRSLATALASGDGDTKTFRSLGGAIAKLVDRVAKNGATLDIYETDDTTVLGQQTITADSSADPIVELNTV